MKARFLLNILLVLGATAMAQQKTTLSATLSADTIDLYSTFSIQYTAENTRNSISVPSLADFDVVGGPMESSSFTSINGKTRTQTSYKITLRPKSTGNFTIQPASVQTPDDLLQTQPLHIVVLQNGVLPSSPITRQPNTTTSEKLPTSANKPRLRQTIDL